MKAIRAYLENQREIAAVQFYNYIQEGGNMIDAAYWLDRMNHLTMMLKTLDNGKEKKKN